METNGTGRRRSATIIAASASAAAGLVHAAAAGSHQGAPTLARLFALCAVAQLGWAAVLALGDARRTTVAVGIALNGAAAAAWLASRAADVPLLSEGGAEAIGAQDLAAAAFAVLAMAAALVALVARSGPGRPTTVAAALTGGLVLALAAPAMAAGHDHGHVDGHDHRDGVAAAAEADDVEGHAHEEGDAHEHATAEVPTAAAPPTTEPAGHDHETEATEQPAATTPPPPADHEHVEAMEGPAATAAAPTTPATAAGHDHPATSPEDDGQPPVPEAQTGPITSVDDPRLTPAQQVTATQLVEATTTGMAGLRTVEAVEAAGYVSIGDGRRPGGFEHFVRSDLLTDGRELDPEAIESVVARVGADGSRTVVSAMYILELGSTMADAPDLAGELAVWHDHQDLCWEGPRLAGRLVDGRCRPGGVLRPTPPMLHVWLVPRPCGPFSGIEGSHGDGCAHAH